MSPEFDLEGFRREMVGMTTRARLLEPVGLGVDKWFGAATLAPKSLRIPGAVQSQHSCCVRGSSNDRHLVS